MEETRPIRAWIRVAGLGRVSAVIDVPVDCFNSSGELIKEDAIEYVERWMTDDLQLEYGCCLVDEVLPPEVTGGSNENPTV